jgi:hypothetical protein
MLAKKDERTFVDDFFDDHEDGGYGLGDKVPHLNLKGEIEEDNYDDLFEDEVPAPADPKKGAQQAGGKDAGKGGADAGKGGADAKAGAGAKKDAGKAPGKK